MENAVGVDYFYDGDGKRVKKDQTGGSTYDKLYWYGLSADPLLETDLSGTVTDEYIFFGGKRTARRKSDGTIHYYFADHLGSSRVVTSTAGAILEDSDYYPFGGERIVTDTTNNNYKFTGKERDTESGLDFFIARYYSSAYGRFLSPDEFTGGPVDAFSSSDPLQPGPLPYADITNAQSLNKYTYTFNNPMSYVDPNGHDAWDVFKGTVEGAVNFIVNTAKGGAELAVAFAKDGGRPGYNTGELVFAPVVSAAQEYDEKGVSGVANAVLDQGEQGAMAIVTEAVLAGGAAASARVNSVKPVSSVQANRSAGLAFQNAQAAQTAATDANVVQNLRVRTTTGVRTEIDIASQTPNGAIRLQEAKGSQGARLTPNQAKAHPQIAQSGATVVSRNKPGYPAGTQIPPTKVEVVRPPIK